MISVFQNKTIDESVIEEIAKKIYNVILNKITKSQTGKSLSCRLKTIDSSFEQLIKTPFDDLLTVEKQFGAVTAEESKFLISLYEKIRVNLGGYIVKKLQLNTCPYCNIDTITCYEYEDQLLTQANFDHYYSKSQHPLLAVCIYNLNIVCNACNIIKSTNNISYSSYNKKLFTDDLLNFTYSLIDEEQIKVVINQLNPATIGKNIATLRLIERYNSDTIIQHVKHIKEIIEHAPDTNSADDIKKYLKYVEQEEYSKDNFSKLTHDIVKELLEIKMKN